MVYLLVETSGQQQLAKLRAGFLEALVENLNGLVSYFGGTRLSMERGTMLFGLAASRAEGEPLSELLYRVYDLLNRNRSELSGFTAIGEEFAEEPEGAVLRHLSAEIWRSAQSDGLWIGPRVRERMESALALRGEGQFQEVIGRSAEGDFAARWKGDFLARPAVVDSLVSAISPFLQSPSGPCWIRVWGPPLVGKGHNLDLALQQACGGTTEWLRLSVPGPGLPFEQPFLSGLRADLLEQVPEYLSRAELAVWEEKRGIFSFVCPDHAFEDLHTAYAHYLLAYRRLMERRLLPPVVIFEGLHDYQPAAHELIARLIRTLAGPAPLVAIGILDCEAMPPPLAEIPIVDAPVGAVGPEELRALLRGNPRAGGRPDEDTEEILARTEGRTLFVHHLLSLGDWQAVRGEEISFALANELDSASRLILFLLYRVAGILGQAEIIRFLSSEEIVQEVVKSSLARLRDLGFIAEHSLAVRTPEAAERIAAEFAPRGFEARFADWCYRLWRKGELRAGLPLVAFLGRFGRFDQTVELFFHVATRLLDRGEVDEVLSWIEQAELFPRPLSPEEARTRDLQFALIALRASVLLQEREQAELHITRIKELTSDSVWEGGLLELAASQHHFAAGETRAALDSAKRALIASQRIEAPFLEYRANIEVGLAMLATARFKEAQDYFAIARGGPATDAGTYDLLRCQGLEGVAHFLDGNLSKAIRMAEEAKGGAVAACRREWQRFLILLRGRCYFAVGSYEKAGELFHAGSAFCRIYPDVSAAKVFAAWAGRAALYAGARTTLRTFESLEPNPEVLFFMGEACLEAGDWERAAILFDRALELLSDLPFRYQPSEVLSWIDAFASIEDLAFRSPNGTGVLYQLVRAARAYARSRLGHAEESAAELMRIVREEKLSDLDPNLPYYHFLHSLVLPEGQGEEAVIRLTALSKALKHVQEQSTRIDEVKKRQSFLQNNRWNARVLADAHRFKLL